MTRDEMQGEINALKQLLSRSDFAALKFAEGRISEKDYAATRELRQAWRNKINKLRSEMESLSEENYDERTADAEQNGAIGSGDVEESFPQNPNEEGAGETVGETVDETVEGTEETVEEIQTEGAIEE